MAGRRRRASNSSVEAVDEDRIRYSKETDILKSVPKGSVSDDWPTFVMTDATVYHRDGRRIANLLDVNLQGPFIVRGKLEIDDREQYKYLVRSSVRSAYIEVQKCWQWSIGYGPIALWASGESGWYEIVPSLRYEAIHTKMCEGIDLYYKILEIYDDANAARKKRDRKLSLDSVFLKYAVAVGDGVVRDEVIQRCVDHAQFLLAQFPQEREFNWAHTTFYKWMVGEFKELNERLMKAAADPSSVLPPPGVESEPVFLADLEPPSQALSKSSSKGRSSSRALRASEEDDVQMADAPRESQRQRSTRRSISRSISSEQPVQAEVAPQKAKPRTTASPAPASLSAGGAARSSTPNNAIALLVDVLNDIANDTPNWQHVKAKTFYARIFYRCKIRPYSMAQDITECLARPLLKHLGEEWKGSGLYNHLRDIAMQPPKEPEYCTREAIASHLLRRNKMQATVARQQSASQARQAAGKLASSPAPDTAVTPRGKRPGRPSGKMSALRLASTSRKRPIGTLDDDDSDDAGEDDDDIASHRGRKSAKTSHTISDEEDEEEEDDDDDDNDDDDDDDTPTSVDDSHGPAAPPGTEPIRIMVRAERIPSTRPSGSNGTWTCEEDGCGYVVRAADVKQGQHLIQDHFREHEDQADRITLAVSESRGLPINHLLEKIRGIGEKAEAAERRGMNGGVLPAPIKRKLLI